MSGKRHQATAFDDGAVEGASKLRPLDQPLATARDQL